MTRSKQSKLKGAKTKVLWLIKTLCKTKSQKKKNSGYSRNLESRKNKQGRQIEKAGKAKGNPKVLPFFFCPKPKYPKNITSEAT